MYLSMPSVYLSIRESRLSLYPLTLVRSAADIRTGILTIREKWMKMLGPESILRETEEMHKSEGIAVPAHWIPAREQVAALMQGAGLSSVLAEDRLLRYPWQVFQWNARSIAEDFALLTEGRQSAALPPYVIVQGRENLFLEPDAILEPCMIHAEDGPVYIGSGARVMAGATLRGPLAICSGATVKMGARIYGGTTVGPHCIVGGELKNAVLWGYSNKAHDGYLGDSVIGAWCNLGAGTSSSNVKNNAREVQVWSQEAGAFIPTGLRKCGLIMGDYSRSAINTSFNTGTVVGVSANVFAGGLTPRHIPSFSWGGADGTRYAFDKAIRDLENWMSGQEQTLEESVKKQLRLIFEQLETQ